MTHADLPHSLDRSLLIRAPRDLVFSFFTDSSRWASWWGQGSTIDPSVGGAVHIRHPNGIEAGGTILEIDPPRRLVFSYGFASGTPMPMGASRVTIALDEEVAGTRLTLHHALADAGARDEHVQGWRFQLSLFANAVADVAHRDVEALVDAWFAMWAEPDAAARSATLARIASSAVQFRDRYSCLDGAEDLLPHMAATQRFMPGLHLKRTGDVRHCQGLVLADWSAVDAEGQPRGQGTNVFVLAADGRIESVTGLWNG